MATFPLYTTRVPWLTTDQMIEVDRAMMEDVRILLIQMMENAGRNLARLAVERFLDGEAQGKRVVVLAGTGGNGGGAMVCARRLSAWGVEVLVAQVAPEGPLPEVPAHQVDVLNRMKVPVVDADALREEAGPVDLVIDGVIGYSLKGELRGPAATLLAWAAGQTAPILSLDAPSGVDTTTGRVFAGAVRATATMTLALPKEGLRAFGVEGHVGELYLADISVPPSVYAEDALDLDVGPIFAQSEIVRLR